MDSQQVGREMYVAVIRDFRSLSFVSQDSEIMLRTIFLAINFFLSCILHATTPVYWSVLSLWLLKRLGQLDSRIREIQALTPFN